MDKEIFKNIKALCESFRFTKPLKALLNEIDSDGKGFFFRIEKEDSFIVVTTFSFSTWKKDYDYNISLDSELELVYAINNTLVFEFQEFILKLASDGCYKLVSKVAIKA